MTVWFTSDLHLGHRFVSGLRGFETAHAHDVALQINWHRVVRPEDQVWVLGDIAVSNPGYALDCIGDWPGRKHLIAGNHDACHPMHRDSYRWQKRYLEVFESVQPFARRRIGAQEVMLSHFPYTADRGDPRGMQYRLPDLGAVLLHGHTHSGAKRTSGREIHVGVDARNLTPVSLDEIAVEIDQPLDIDETDV